MGNCAICCVSSDMTPVDVRQLIDWELELSTEVGQSRKLKWVEKHQEQSRWHPVFDALFTFLENVPRVNLIPYAGPVMGLKWLRSKRQGGQVESA